MDSLKGDDLKLACRVTYSKYKTCIKNSIVKDVLGNIDPAAPARNCGSLFADLTDYCSEHLMSGEFVLDRKAQPGSSASTAGAAVAEKK